MSRFPVVIIPWLVMGGAVALAGTLRWVDTGAPPPDFGDARPHTSWSVMVSSENAVTESVTVAAAPSPRSAPRRAPPVLSGQAHARGEAVLRAPVTSWEKLARDGQLEADVARVALDTQLETLEADLRQVVQLARQDATPASRRIDLEARVLLRETQGFRAGPSRDVEELRARVTRLVTRAQLELVRR
jgi:hypothetical protein